MSWGPGWANRRRLLRARKRLTQQQFTKIWTEILAQETTDELLTVDRQGSSATWLALARNRPPRSEVTTLTKTIEAWRPQIFAFADTGINGAGTEANNPQLIPGA
jgi:hypothetical protein